MDKKTEIFNRLLNILKNNDDLTPRIPLHEITYETRLSADCGFDSLVLMSILYELQETYPDLDEYTILEVKTFNDLIEKIANKI